MLLDSFRGKGGGGRCWGGDRRGVVGGGGKGERGMLHI